MFAMFRRVVELFRQFAQIFAQGIKLVVYIFKFFAQLSDGFLAAFPFPLFHLFHPFHLFHVGAVDFLFHIACFTREVFGRFMESGGVEVFDGLVEVVQSFLCFRRYGWFGGAGTRFLPTPLRHRRRSLRTTFKSGTVEPLGLALGTTLTPLANHGVGLLVAAGLARGTNFFTVFLHGLVAEASLFHPSFHHFFPLGPRPIRP